MFVCACLQIAAAYVSGLIDVPTALRIAFENGTVASAVDGKMAHTVMPLAKVSELPAELHVAAINYKMSDETASVTLCGDADAVAKYLAADSVAVELRPNHPWHHPTYRTTDAHAAWGRAAGAVDADLSVAVFKQPADSTCAFISPTTGEVATQVDAPHWSTWLSAPVKFDAALEKLAALAATRKEEPVYVIQIASHPVLEGAIGRLSALLEATTGQPLAVGVSSMKRGVLPSTYMRSERAKLAAANLLHAPLLRALGASGTLDFETPARKITLDPPTPFAEQGITSALIPALTRRLAPFFPGLNPHDLYRYTSLDALVIGWDAAATAAVTPVGTGGNAGAALDVLGWGVRLPTNVTSGEEMWQALLEDESAITQPPAGFKVRNDAGFLKPQFTAEHAIKVARACGIDAGEAAVIEPQHALALDLVKQMFEHVGPTVTEAVLANRERVGVYIGAWQSPADDATKRSAYAAIGTSLSALAARVANVFNLNGPALTINTACSSALVAVDTALRDARAGRIDYAIVGGVNLIATSPKAADAFAALRAASMLSPTSRCHTFSAAADGYVRAEGGVVFLVRSTAAPPPAGVTIAARATIAGTAVNQNTQRKPMTAVDPVAQERVVRAACADAGISPSDLSAVELHGTGTKLGDPVELSALAAVTASDSADSKCTVTAAKMNFGHLESAAGGVGLLKACLMLQRRLVPPFEVDAPGVNDALTEIFASSRLQLPAVTGTPLPEDAYVGVSSFGFAGNNAHVVLRRADGADMVVPELVQPEMVAAMKAARLAADKSTLVILGDDQSPEVAVAVAGNDASAARKVWEAVCDIVGETVPFQMEANLFDLGVDSLGMAELVIQIEEAYGEGSISIDDVLASPTLGEVAAKIVVTGGTPPARVPSAPAPAKTRTPGSLDKLLTATTVAPAPPMPKTTIPSAIPAVAPTMVAPPATAEMDRIASLESQMVQQRGSHTYP